ncbi:hypothetical protein ZEAMMB73_Zm00001d028489 [Zea mays]|uniref:ABC1 atypical kinase-like domain-containing protein n=1 Tax=Zea mays TaxID=4577 RepID=A0A1D6JWR8_MAIZE|nr:hypothetical protein ZEAMMB73_Zm00001d028489 [Zea mays]
MLASEFPLLLNRRSSLPRLVTLCDQAPSTPFDVVRNVVEKQLGKNFDDMFEFFDVEPVGSASIAQVHRARLKLSKTDVVVKRIGDTLDFEIKRWSTGKQGNLRALLSTLQYIRPSDKKVDYQIQKLTNAVDNATAREKSGNAEANGKDRHSDEEDLLKYRPNPDMMDTDWS